MCLENSNCSYYSPQQLLNHALFVLSFLNTGNKGLTPMYKHWNQSIEKKYFSSMERFVNVKWKDPGVLIVSRSIYQDIHAPM